MDDVFENNGKLSLSLFSSDAMTVLSESIKHAVATRSFVLLSGCTRLLTVR